MLLFGIAVAFALAAADRARNREASPMVWGGITLLICIAAGKFGDVIALIPVGMLMVLAAAKMGKTTRECPNCGKTTRIAALACPHCGASPRSKFMSGI
jgi:hypothetical protein